MKKPRTIKASIPQLKKNRYPEIASLFKTKNGKNIKGYQTPYLVVTTAEKHAGRDVLVANGAALELMGWKNAELLDEAIPVVRVKTTRESNWGDD